MPLTLDKAFDPRANSIGFLRWLMAFAVIFSHAGPLAGFYDGEDLGVQLSHEQSLGGVAVAGFFFFSGFLITKSRRGKSTIFRYFWRRALRIFPAFWLALLLTAFVLAPIAWNQSRGDMDAYWNATTDSPLTYFWNNMWLELGQRNIAGMGESLPLAVQHGGHDWNGSAWTLEYEFKAYIIVGLLGLFGLLANRWLGGFVAVCFIVVNALQWGGAMNVGTGVYELFGNPYNAMFFAPFSFGMLFALFGDYIPIDDRVVVFAGIIAFLAYANGGWNVWGQYAFLYVLMWVAVRAPLTNWERFGDFSYGIYIYAWPIMTFSAFFGLQDTGWFIYHLVIVAACHVAAFLSWHLIEQPAMSLKNWTPRWLAWLIDRGRPAVDAVKRRLVDPRFSSANFAQRMLAERAQLATAGAAAAVAAPSSPQELTAPEQADPVMEAAPAPVSSDAPARSSAGAASDSAGPAPAAPAVQAVQAAPVAAVHAEAAPAIAETTAALARPAADDSSAATASAGLGAQTRLAPPLDRHARPSSAAATERDEQPSPATATERDEQPSPAAAPEGEARLATVAPPERDERAAEAASRARDEQAPAPASRDRDEQAPAAASRDRDEQPSSAAGSERDARPASAEQSADGEPEWSSGPEADEASARTDDDAAQPASAAAEAPDSASTAADEGRRAARIAWNRPPSWNRPPARSTDEEDER